MSRNPSFPILETKRLVLRQLAADDSESWFQNLSNDEITGLIGMDPLETIEELEAIIKSFNERFKEGAGIAWAITLKETNEFIGTCSYESINKKNRSGEIGYDLLREYWGHGFMTEALRAIIEYGFRQIGLDRIEANTDPVNIHSRNLLERLGFIEEGTFRESASFTGEFGDDIHYSLYRRK
jgi:ribosomal-protein-alanine N-acetyltransferase